MKVRDVYVAFIYTVNSSSVAWQLTCSCLQWYSEDWKIFKATCINICAYMYTTVTFINLTLIIYINKEYYCWSHDVVTWNVDLTIS